VNRRARALRRGRGHLDGEVRKVDGEVRNLDGKVRNLDGELLKLGEEVAHPGAEVGNRGGDISEVEVDPANHGLDVALVPLDRRSPGGEGGSALPGRDQAAAGSGAVPGRTGRERWRRSSQAFCGTSLARWTASVTLG
jgi:hypothetical protein